MLGFVAIEIRRFEGRLLEEGMCGKCRLKSRVRDVD